MNAYELVLILKDDKEASLKQVTQLLEEKKGKIVKTDTWGKKNLAYPIKKNTSGFFYIVNLEAEKDIIQDFKKKLDYNEDVLRYLLLSL
ncbi:MAG TPA: 30S ribosomal protein S6 [Candidatus Nitrosocosmicus sp.]|nr:30S ribosomal protein S6 [Candidatus Nitrosocosmicus sp.]